MSIDPAHYKTRVSYAWAHTEIGRVLVASTWKGICFTSLGTEGALARLGEWVARHEPGAKLVEDRRALRPVLQRRGKRRGPPKRASCR